MCAQCRLVVIVTIIIIIIMYVYSAQLNLLKFLPSTIARY